MKELNQVGFNRLGKSSIFENGGAVVDIKDNGTLTLMVDYDSHTDWKRILALQVGEGYFKEGFSLITITSDLTVMERTLNGSGGGFSGERKPDFTKFQDKTIEQQLLETGFESDLIEPNIFRYQLQYEGESGEVIAWTSGGKVERMTKPIRPALQAMLDDKTQIIDCTEEPYEWGGASTVLTVRNSTMEFKINLIYGGSLVEGSQKLLRNVEPEELDIRPLEIVAEQSGFKIGGRNETELIKELTEINGQPVEKLESRMRPMRDSMAGFLGENESLLYIMASDNDFVLSQKLTHQDLAAPLFYAREHYFKGFGTQFSLGGRKFRVEMDTFRGMQFSPFEDETGTASDMTITNLDTGVSLKCSCLLPDMIQRYGFYEGKQTPYRLEPTSILEVFDFIPN